VELNSYCVLNSWGKAAPTLPIHSVEPEFKRSAARTRNKLLNIFIRHTFIDGSLLEDGAWMRLRLSRSDHYTGVREWYSSDRALKVDIASLVMDVQQDAKLKEDAMKMLRPSNTGDSTIWDKFVKLGTVILNDAFLSADEAALHVGELAGIIAAAKKANSGPQCGRSCQTDNRLAGCSCVRMADWRPSRPSLHGACGRFAGGETRHRRKRRSFDEAARHISGLHVFGLRCTR
jgi:hypothetical protein